MPGPLYKPYNLDVENLASKLPEPLQWPAGAILGGLKHVLGGDDPEGSMLASASAPLMAAEPAAPVKGLLDMSPVARLKRAVEQGFTNEMYHGTNANFSEFDPMKVDFGIHVTPSTVTANSAIGTTATKGAGGRFAPGANIMPLRVKMEKTLDLPDMNLWGSPHHWETRMIDPQNVNQVGRSNFINPNLGTNDPELAQKLYDLARQHETGTFEADARELIRNAGYDSIKYPNTIEGKGEPSYILLNPRNIRSTNAAFDPAKLGKTKDILASGAPLLGLKSLFGKKDEQ